MGYPTPRDRPCSLDVVGRAIHTCHADGVWVNTLGRDITLTRHPDRHEAIVEGRRLAMQRRTLLVVHAEDGAVDFSEDHRY